MPQAETGLTTEALRPIPLSPCRRAAGLRCSNEKPVYQFERKKPVDFCRVVAIALEVAIDNSANRIRVKVWPGQRTRIEQHFPHIVGKLVAVPHSKMKWLVPAEP